MKKDRIIIWATEVFQLIEGKPVGGVAVQMMFWAQNFVKHGWEVYSFAENEKRIISKSGIIFKPKRNSQRINFLLEWFHAVKFIVSIRPNLIIYRGANRELWSLAFISRLFGVKLAFFAASDVNFEPGKELVGSEMNRRLYHRAIKHIKYFLVQNEHQKATLYSNYGKDSKIIYNIWGTTDMVEQIKPTVSDVIWIANFRRLKRAEWVLESAEKLPEYHFILAGAASGDRSYYDDINRRASMLPNVDFLGGQSFFYANSLVANSKVLLCTSTFEGFPNTFLQAWSNGLPVISTVDPSGIIRKNNLGIVVETVDELTTAIRILMDNKENYDELRKSILPYFEKNHSSEYAFNKLMSYIS